MKSNQIRIIKDILILLLKEINYSGFYESQFISISYCTIIDRNKAFIMYTTKLKYTKKQIKYKRTFKAHKLSQTLKN